MILFYLAPPPFMMKTFDFMNNFDSIYCLFFLFIFILILIKIIKWKKMGVGYLDYAINKIYYKIFKKNGNRKILNCQRCKRYYTNLRYEPYCCKKCFKEANLEKKQIFRHNNRCNIHKLQRMTYRGQCWDCYRNNWKHNHQKKHFDKILILRLYGFKVIPTFKSSKDGWSGDKIAFDQNLADNGYRWFIYVKLYVEKIGRKNIRIKPIVIGKSGSILVNSSGCDLSFSMNENDGPARRFLIKNGYCWYQDYILIKRCKNELDAYNKERKFMKLFHLYGS